MVYYKQFLQEAQIFCDGNQGKKDEHIQKPSNLLSNLLMLRNAAESLIALFMRCSKLEKRLTLNIETDSTPVHLVMCILLSSTSHFILM